MVKWTRKFINDLPDAAFAVIYPEGKKDEEGKTVPRDNRHLPHHNMNVKHPNDHESVDIEHLRNALARLKQTDIPAEQKRKALEHLLMHARVLLKEYKDLSDEEWKKVKEEKLAEIKNTVSDLIQLLKNCKVTI